MKARSRPTPNPAATAGAPAGDARVRTLRRAAWGLIIAAILIRGVLALLMPSMSRDGVTFCWYAADLREQGVAYLQTDQARQHPLFPLLILGVFEIAQTFGAVDDPWVWQRCGQVVTLAAGVAVLLLSGAIARRLTQRLELPLNAEAVRVAAIALAALLPLHNWLSADVMSDEVYLAFFLGAGRILVDLHCGRTALFAGLLGGLAFLTRPEGAVLPLAGLAALALQVGKSPLYRIASRAALLLIGFAMLATPYWAITGKFSNKKDVMEVAAASAPLHARAPAAVALPPGLLLAKLEMRDVAWYAVAPDTLYTLFRAGRVVIPLLAIAPLWSLRRRWLSPALAGLLAAAAGHFALTLLLLWKYDYQAPRHLLPVVGVLSVFAAMLLARLHGLYRERGIRGGHLLLGIVVYAPLLLIALRVPNGADGYWVTAANALRRQDSHIADRTILSGSSARRLVYYAGAKWAYWPEEPEQVAALWRLMRVGAADYFALEVGSGFETRGNAELRTRIETDPPAGLMFAPVVAERVAAERELAVYRVGRS